MSEDRSVYGASLQWKQRYDLAVSKTHDMDNIALLRMQALEIARKVIKDKAEYRDLDFMVGIPIGSLMVYEQIIKELGVFPCAVFIESRLLPGRAMIHVHSHISPLQCLETAS